MEVKEILFRVPTLLAEERNLGLAIFRLGQSQAKPGYRRHTYHKPAYTLKIIVQGRGTIRTAQGEQQMKAGDVVLYWQGCAYEWWTDPHNLLQHYWLDLEGSSVIDMFRYLTTPEKCVLTRDALPANELVLFQELLHLYRDQPPHYVWKSLAVFFDLWHSVAETALGEQQIIQSPARHAKAFIDTHYMVNISVCDVAQNVGVTPQYLATAFRKRYGITPHEYILNCRLQAATRLLRGKTPVQEAAAMVGFDDPNYFSRLFSKHMGVCPSSLVSQSGR